MNAKERVITALEGRCPDIVPVTFDYLELYLEEEIERRYVEGYRTRLESEKHVRLDRDEDAEIWASAIVGALDSAFVEPFDWIPLPGGFGPERPAKRELCLDSGRVYEVDLDSGQRREMLRPAQEKKSEEIHEALSSPKTELRNERDVDRVLADRRHRRVLEAQEEVAVARHAVARRGDERFLYVGVSAPFVEAFSILGFEGLMLSMLDSPQLLHRLLSGLLEQTVRRAEILAATGVHGVRMEEALASADMISPQHYEEFAFPYERRLAYELRQMGLFTFLYFGGDVIPRLPYIVEIGVHALAVEESKKGFVIDIAEVRDRVGPEMCLVGNLDSYGTVQQGTPQEVEDELVRQLKVAGENGAFMVGIGSPLPLDTDIARVNLAASLARELGRYDSQGEISL